MFVTFAEAVAEGSLVTDAGETSWSGLTEEGYRSDTLVIKKIGKYNVIATFSRPQSCSVNMTVFAPDGVILVDELNINGMMPKDDDTTGRVVSALFGAFIGAKFASKGE